MTEWMQNFEFFLNSKFDEFLCIWTWRETEIETSLIDKAGGRFLGVF